jgi:proteasome lid subunit RPN8/RPN11
VKMGRRTNKMKIILKEIAKRKIEAYTKLATDEISGLMRAERVDEQTILVKDIILLKQESSPSDTELDIDALSRYLTEEIQADRDISDIKGWWHSHADMGVFWSTTDTENMDTFGKEWLVSIVSNKKGEKLARVDIYNPYRMFINDVTIENEEHELTEREAKINTLLEKLADEERAEEEQYEAVLAAEILEKVKEPRVKVLDYTSHRDWSERGRKSIFNSAEDEFYGDQQFIDDKGEYPIKKYRELICPSIDCNYRRIVKKSKSFSGMHCQKCGTPLVSIEDYWRDGSERWEDE